MRMRETALFLLLVWNLTSPSCSSTRFIIWRGNFSDSRTLKAEIGIFVFAWTFRTFWPKMAVLGAKIGEWVVRCWLPPNSFLLLGVVTSVPLFVKINQEMRPWECGQTDGQTDRRTHARTETNWLYNLSYAICYAMGKMKTTIYYLPPYSYSVSPGSVEALVRWSGKIKHILIASFLSNTSVKNYQNRFRHAKVIARQSSDTFLRRSV